MLRSRPSWTTSGNQLTLICETQLPPQKSDVQLQFRFFKDGQIVEEGSKNFLKIWNPSSGMNKGPSYYWCEAHTVTSNVCKKSQKSQIHVEGGCLSGLRFARKSRAESHGSLDFPVNQKKPHHSWFQSSCCYPTHHSPYLLPASSPSHLLICSVASP